MGEPKASAAERKQRKEDAGKKLQETGGVMECVDDLEELGKEIIPRKQSDKRGWSSQLLVARERNLRRTRPNVSSNEK